MRKTRAITLTVLSALMLTACCITTVGCGRRTPPPPDHTWYDAGGNAIPEKWKTDEHGNRGLDAEGRPIPDPHVPFDRYHRPWVYVNGTWQPQDPPASAYSSSSSSHTYSSRPGLWLWGGSGYRSTGGSSYHPAASSSSSGSSISRGGFGSTGSSSSWSS